MGLRGVAYAYRTVYELSGAATETKTKSFVILAQALSASRRPSSGGHAYVSLFQKLLQKLPLDVL